MTAPVPEVFGQGRRTSNHTNARMEGLNGLFQAVKGKESLPGRQGRCYG